jgi:hypothetical protein
MRQVLTIAKIHLYAYALREGPYQTRAVFKLWARAIWEETWYMVLGNRPYQPPDENILNCVSSVCA